MNNENRHDNVYRAFLKYSSMGYLESRDNIAKSTIDASMESLVTDLRSNISFTMHFLSNIGRIIEKEFGVKFPDYALNDQPSFSKHYYNREISLEDNVKQAIVDSFYCKNYSSDLRSIILYLLEDKPSIKKINV